MLFKGECMKYQKVFCRIHNKDLITVSNYFFDHDCLGTEVKERLINFENNYGEIYNLNQENYQFEGVILIAYFRDVNFIDDFKEYLKCNNIELLDEIIIEQYEDYDYEKQYKENFSEIKISNNLSIVPPWFQGFDKNKTYIKIEAATGFGTGKHPSTQLAILNLLQYYNHNDIMLDFGTGSGILAIIGKKIGIKKVYAIDIDALALKNAIKNRKLNDVEIIIENKSIESFAHKVSLIVANIVCDVLINTLNIVKKVLEPNGIYILSGILENQEKMLIEHLKKHGFEILNIKKSNNWVSIVSKLT